MLKEMELTEILSLVSGHLNFLVLSMIYLKDARKMPLICMVNIRDMPETCLRYFQKCFT